MAPLPENADFTISTTSTLPWSIPSYAQLALITGSSGFDRDCPGGSTPADVASAFGYSRPTSES